MQTTLKAVVAASLLSLAGGGAFAADGGQVGGGQGQKKAAKMADQAGPQGGPQGGGQLKMQKKGTQMDKPPTPGGPGTAHKKMDKSHKGQGVISVDPPPPGKGSLKGGAMKDQAGPQGGPQGGPQMKMQKSGGKMADQAGPQGGPQGGPQMKMQKSDASKAKAAIK